VISCEADKAGRVLVIRYCQRVGVEEMRRFLGTVEKVIAHLEPGFVLLTDLSHLKSMDASCAPEIGLIMDLCRERGMSMVMRVVPDPLKDIGFNVISRFHLHPRVKTRTYPNLADAIGSLLGKHLAEIPAR
jgi:anti-anti-sigma regulatory factor